MLFGLLGFVIGVVFGFVAGYITALSVETAT